MSRPIREYTPVRDAHATQFGLRQEVRKTGGSWIYVGDTYDENAPPFTTGNNVGPPWQELRFRWLVDGGIEIEGVIEGVSAGDVIFTLPADLYTPDQDGDVPVPGVNVADNSHVAFSIQTNGDVVFLG